MAVSLLGVVITPVLKKALSLAAEEISRFWALDEELRKLVQKLELIEASLSDAQSKQFTSQVVHLWLKRLQSIVLDAEIVLDDFGYEVLRKKIKCRKRDKVCSFISYSNPLSFRPEMARRIKEVILSLEEVYAESNQIGLRAVELINLLPDLKEHRLTDPFLDNSKIVGREDDVSKVISMLTDSNNGSDDLSVITILGMGGQGKTTLAQLIYNDDKVKSHFDEAIWVCVSNNFNLKRLLGEVLRSLTQTNENLTSMEVLVNRLRGYLGGKRYLLVLDDVWNENKDKWERLKICMLAIGGFRGSKILATTRKDDVASVMETFGYHRLQTLSEDQSWELFEKCTFAEGGATKTPQLINLGKRILKRCRGVPLAIKAIGGLLYSKNSESDWSLIERSEMWSASSGGDEVFSAIKLSYDHLPSWSLKQCFAYCSIFQKDTVMEKDMLIQLWMAQGLINPPKGSDLQMEDMGNIYFNILLRSSLLQHVEEDHHHSITCCKMYELVHDVSLQMSKNYCFHLKDLMIRSNEIEAVHILICSSGKGTCKSLKGVFTSKLRTLYLKGVYLSQDLIANFRCLSILIIQDRSATNVVMGRHNKAYLLYDFINGSSFAKDH